MASLIISAREHQRILAINLHPSATQCDNGVMSGRAVNEPLYDGWLAGAATFFWAAAAAAFLGGISDDVDGMVAALMDFRMRY